MDLHRKALYNLLHINRQVGSNTTLTDGQVLEPWQLENYREKSNHQLIQELHAANVGLKPNDFEAYAKNYESPEEMTDSLTGDLDYRSQDKVYLIIFELWRRLLPEKQSISIFCDELDHQIILYDREETTNPSDMQDALAYLQHLLDNHVDEGIDPKEAFYFIQNHCANDLESFLYDYILEDIDAGNVIYASELLDGFLRYMEDRLWFEFLKIRVELLKENDDAVSLLDQFIDDLMKESQLQLDLEVLHFLAKQGVKDVFARLSKKTFNQLELEEDLQDFISILQSYFHETHHYSDEKTLQDILEKRSSYILEAEIQRKDPHITQIKHLIDSI